MLDKPQRQSLRTRPEHLQAKYQIGKSTYYKRTRYLDIQTQKDEHKKVYLTHEQVAQLDQLHNYIQTHGTMIGFKTSQRIDKNLHPSSIVPSSVEEAQGLIISSPVEPGQGTKTLNNFPKALRPTALKV